MAAFCYNTIGCRCLSDEIQLKKFVEWNFTLDSETSAADAPLQKASSPPPPQLEMLQPDT